MDPSVRPSWNATSTKTNDGIYDEPRLDEAPRASRVGGRSQPLNASGTEEDRPKSTQPPVARRQIRRTFASPAQDDELLLQQEVLRHHRSFTARATELRGHDGEVKQGEQEVPHLPVSVGQTSGAAQRCRIQDSARELAIRDHRRRLLSPLASAGVACCRSSAVKTGTPG